MYTDNVFIKNTKCITVGLQGFIEYFEKFSSKKFSAHILCFDTSFKARLCSGTLSPWKRERFSQTCDLKNRRAVQTYLGAACGEKNNSAPNFKQKHR